MLYIIQTRLTPRGVMGKVQDTGRLTAVRLAQQLLKKGMRPHNITAELRRTRHTLTLRASQFAEWQKGYEDALTRIEWLRSNCNKQGQHFTITLLTDALPTGLRGLKQFVFLEELYVVGKNGLQHNHVRFGRVALQQLEDALATANRPPLPD